VSHNAIHWFEIPVVDLERAQRFYEALFARAGELGARVLLPKLELPRDIGFIAQIVDSEGNRIGLHSPAA
jgi:predicted enzyme related to lactoylglutathione lyase